MKCDCQLTDPVKGPPPHHRGHCDKEAAWILKAWNRPLCSDCRRGYQEWSRSMEYPWGDNDFAAIVVPKQPKQPDPFSLLSLPPELWPEDVRELWASVQDDLGLLPGETVDEVRYTEVKSPSSLRMICQFVYRVVQQRYPNAGEWRVLEFDGASDLDTSYSYTYSYTLEWMNKRLDRKP